MDLGVRAVEVRFGASCYLMKKSPSSLRYYRFWPWAIASCGEYPRRKGGNEQGMRAPPENYGFSCSINISKKMLKLAPLGYLVQSSATYCYVRDELRDAWREWRCATFLTYFAVDFVSAVRSMARARVHRALSSSDFRRGFRALVPSATIHRHRRSTGAASAMPSGFALPYVLIASSKPPPRSPKSTR